MLCGVLLVSTTRRNISEDGILQVAQSFLTSAKYGWDDQVHVLPLYPGGGGLITLFVGGCRSSRTGLGATKKRNISYSCRNRTPVPWSSNPQHGRYTSWKYWWIEMSIVRANQSGKFRQKQIWRRIRKWELSTTRTIQRLWMRVNVCVCVYGVGGKAQAKRQIYVKVLSGT
jgi:hypothetical protein